MSIHDRLASGLFVVVLALLSLAAPASETADYSAAEYENACGPISAFVAMRSMGLKVDLATVAQECGWSAGAYTGAEDVAQSLRNRPELEVRTAKLSDKALASHLRNGGVAIVFVRRNASIPNHALCIVAQNGDGFIYVEMPEGKGTLDRGQLAEVWSGEAILVSRPLNERLRSEWPFFLFPALVLGICLMASVRSLFGWMFASLKKRLSQS